jgi:hypothetical protein
MGFRSCFDFFLLCLSQTNSFLVTLQTRSLSMQRKWKALGQRMHWAMAIVSPDYPHLKQ